MKTLSADQMRPFIRYAQLLNINSSLQFKNIAAYDCRFFFVCEGTGEIVVNGVSYTMNEGSLMLWQPGIEYSLLSGKEKRMKLIGFNFDFCNFHRQKSIPIPPSQIDIFRSEEILMPYAFSDIESLNNPILQINRQSLEPELIEIYTEYKNKIKFYEEKISGKFLSILTDIIRLEELIKNNEQKHGNADKILKIIKERYAEPLTNQAISSELGYHPNHVNRLMVMCTGMSLHQYLQTFRISKAMELLQTTGLSVSQIGEAVGFKDFTHFSKYFKKKTGYTPTAFRSGK